ncbi:MAG: DNA repair protein RecO [Endomicrobium sp.]|jgi:DNA repair protein RecO (recombination protein O)|nr:DNA repair protein RecO [Endomicrobium sp.]
MYYTIKGLVLNSKIQGEHDKLITVYSYQWGKIQAIVPSAKKIAAKLSAATEPLTESEFHIFNSCFSIRPKITGAVIINNNTTMKSNFMRNLYALYAAEVGDKFAPSYLANTEKYDLIVRIWEILNVCKYPKRALIAFILRFLKLSGYSFSDYIRNNGSFIDKRIAMNIRKLSTCSGYDVDFIEEIEDEKIWNYVESYLTNYIRRPAVSIFLQKMNAKS